MEQLILTTQHDISRLMGMMYLDIGKYSFKKVNSGVSIQFDLENPESIDFFAERFLVWFLNEAFIVNGDQYFKDHELQEKWEIWRRDFRFLRAYCDDLYEMAITKWWRAILDIIEEYDGIELKLETLFKQVSGLTEIRMKLVQEHFMENKHEDYITLRYESWKAQNNLLFSNERNVF